MIFTVVRKVSHQMVAIMQTGRRISRQTGYTLLAVLVLIMIIGLGLAEAGAMWSDARRLEREQELLKVGDKLRIAIGQYYNHTPGTVKQYPPTLEALLRDNRFLVPQRYIRQIYIDPITRREGWGILEAPSGGVMGVYSLSGDKPFKVKQFRPVYKEFENKKMYAEWIFAYLPQQITINR